MFKEIVVAIDGSVQSLRAADRAIELAKISRAYVYVVYAVDSTTSKADVLSTWNSLGITQERKKKFKSVEQCAEKEGVSYEVKIIRGEPANAIVNFAQEVEANLIVIGSRGLSQLQQLVLGSVSHKVLKRATCPVLVIK
ncbi:universal stress protein [Halalkalibacter kiskunsagensis]|uniref:Universal stress protein n=1 Tax=Halalkalibacter kiskunsagensis TaxID=1548599 RepID=A0ABV6KGA2_9BACI